MISRMEVDLLDVVVDLYVKQELSLNWKTIYLFVLCCIYSVNLGNTKILQTVLINVDVLYLILVNLLA